jgi:hypothetical protein
MPAANTWVPFQTAKQLWLYTLLICLQSILIAQSIVTGGITGSITDSTGAVVARATVVLTESSTGVRQSTVANSAGIYSFLLVKPGLYQVSATAPGFAKAQQNLEVLLGQTTPLDMRLELGSASETIEVASATESLQTEDGNANTAVSGRQLENLPSPGGDLTNFAQTAPGIVMNTASGGGYGNFSAFGLPATSNLFSINGADYNDPLLNVNFSGASNLLLGSNEIQEAAVITNAYSGQYGRHAGAYVGYTTKSGTNGYHGNASYFWTGRAMDANDWFNNFNGVPRPFQNNNQWTASVGGPIQENKIFFFVNTEGLRYIFGTSQQIFIPAPLFQSEVLTNIPAAAVPFYQNMFQIYNSGPGAARAVLSPNSCSGYQPINPAIGTSCLESYRDATTNGNREWLLSARVDFTFGKKDSLFLRWKMDRGLQPTYTDPFTPIFNIQSNQPIDEGQANYTHVFSSNLVNNALFSVVHPFGVFTSPDFPRALSLFPYILQSTDTSLTGLGPGANSNGRFPQGRGGPNIQFIDDLSWSRGHHNLRFGANLLRNLNTDYNIGSPPFPFIATSLMDFAADTADIVTQNFAKTPKQHDRSFALGVYAQDQWAVNPSLNLTLTLRADYNPVPICVEQCASFTTEPFNSPDFSHSATTPYNQMVFSTQRTLRNVQQFALQPRFGFAYTFADGRTVIRGGAGLFMDTQSPGDIFSYNFPGLNQFSVSGAFALSPEVPQNAQTSVAACNTAFSSNFASGGTVTSYLASNPGCGVPRIFDVLQNYKTPKYLEWNLELQHSLSPSTTASLNYVGNYGYGEGGIAYGYPNGFGFAGLPASVPDTRVNAVIQAITSGISNYNGLTASLRQSIWKGFTGRLNFTWSHALDEVSNGGFSPYSLNNSIYSQLDPNCLRCLNYSSADYDVRIYVSGSYVWDLPIHSESRILKTALAGWTLSQTIYHRTGLPFTVDDSVLQSALSANNIFSAGIAYPSGAGDISYSCGRARVVNGLIAPCFTADKFLPAGTEPGWGGFRRNSFRGPGYFNTDLTVRKTFKISERLQLSVAAIAYNVLNHPNFANPVSDLGNSSQFGVINSTVSPPTTPYGSFAAAAEDARIVQLNGRITF